MMLLSFIRTNLRTSPLGLVFGITLLVTMGISSVLPAFPLLADVFGFPLEDSWMLIVAFALPGLICIPFVGIWADRYGRKQVLIPALLLFALGGVLCMAASSFAQLIAFRILQGIGSAPLGLLYPTIIADTWEGEQRLRVMSINAMVLGMGTAISPAIGGALAMLDWRLPFLLPLMALPLAWFALSIPLMQPGEKKPLGRYIRETLASVRGRQTMTLLGLTLLTFIMLSGPLITCFPMLAEHDFSATPLEIGGILSVSSLASGLAASQLPRLYRAFSTSALLLVSFALYALSLFAMALVPALWWLIPSITLYGLAQGLNIPIVSTLLTGQAPDQQRGALMAANAILLRLGQNIGPALFGGLAGIMGPAASIASGSALALGMAFLVLSTPLPPISSGSSGLPPPLPSESL